MKEFRILTFHNVHNYGALLQCRALSKFLKDFGNCKVLNYTGLKSKYGIINRYSGRKNKLRAVYHYLALKKRYDLMESYINDFEMTEEFTKETVNNINLKDAICIAGSDQIWSCGDGFDPVYFFDNVNAKRKISYAASMGRSYIPAEHKAKVGELLSDFHHISVREKSVKELLNKEYGLETQTVLDPVFLQPKEFWLSESSKVKVPPKYILTYFLTVPPFAKEIVAQIKLKFGLPVVAVTTIYPGKKYLADMDVIAAGPNEFLWLFANAEYILTSSFHGTAFSIIFEKNFNTLCSISTSERMKDLLNELGLEDRIVCNEQISNDEPVDYHSVSQKLQILKNKSIQFLMSSIDSE